MRDGLQEMQHHHRAADLDRGCARRRQYLGQSLGPERMPALQAAKIDRKH